MARSLRAYLLLFIAIAGTCFAFSWSLSFLMRQPLLPLLIASGGGGLIFFGVIVAILAQGGGR